MKTNTAKNFVLQLGSLIALYVSLVAFVTLVFSIINIHFPDALDGYWQYESAQNSIRFSLAVLIIFFPAYLTLTRLVNKARRQDTGIYLVLTKWLIYLSLLVGGLILLGDLVSVIMTFLNGEITTRFLLKAGALLIIVGSAFDYYLLDAKDYWQTREKLSIQVGLMISLVVTAAIIAGYYTVDAPSVIRDIRLDEQQVTDLQDIQWRLEAHFAEKQTFPATIDQLYPVTSVPSAPDGRPAYRYTFSEVNTVQLCATFAYSSQEDGFVNQKLPRIDVLGPIDLPYNWEHTDGEVCFDRVFAKIESE